jgi:hypothetical protein
MIAVAGHSEPEVLRQPYIRAFAINVAQTLRPTENITIGSLKLALKLV